VVSRGPKALTDGIRAVAFLLTDVNRQQTADAITTSVKSQLDEYMETFAANVETMRDAVEHIMAAAKEITGKMDDFKDGFQETAEQLMQATQDFTEKTTENRATTMATPHHTQQVATTDPHGTCIRNIKGRHHR
jgi:predicted  nucleic acid-binding Zn-ribbon protein